MASYMCHNDAIMELQPYVESIHRQLEIAAEAGGDEARALAERLAAPLDAAIRLALQDALVAAAEEITIELAPGSVELRLRGREPRFVVTLPTGPLDDGAGGGDEPRASDLPPAVSGEEGAQARINVRMPERLKAQVDTAAAGDGLSVNAWLVRAAAAAVERSEAARRQPRGPRGGQRYTGWAR
jgi:hypothetical protein